MPRDIGDIGFPMVLHPRDPGTLWVFPMDGTSVWPRVPIGGQPAAYGSRDAGDVEAHGPRAAARAGVVHGEAPGDGRRPLDPVGLYFGTSNGEVWASFDEGASWNCLCLHLPHVYSVEAALLA
jgi:hypothetical protein